MAQVSPCVSFHVIHACAIVFGCLSVPSSPVSNKNGCRFGEKCSFAHRQVDAQPTKWSKSNNDKSAVALLKKGDWHERGSVTDRSHDRSGKPDKRSDKKLGQKSSQRQLSDARLLGCVFPGVAPPKSNLRKSTDMPKTIQRVKFKKAIARHTKIRDQNL